MWGTGPITVFRPPFLAKLIGKATVIVVGNDCATGLVRIPLMPPRS
jgi:hypothetical protein